MKTLAVNSFFLVAHCCFRTGSPPPVECLWENLLANNHATLAQCSYLFVFCHLSVASCATSTSLPPNAANISFPAVSLCNISFFCAIRHRQGSKLPAVFVYFFLRLFQHSRAVDFFPSDCAYARSRAFLNGRKHKSVFALILIRSLNFR